MGRRAFLPRRGSGLLHRSPAQRYFMYDDIFNEVSGARKRVQRIFYLRSAFTTFFPRRGLPSQVKGARLRALSRRSSSVQIAPLAFGFFFVVSGFFPIQHCCRNCMELAAHIGKKQPIYEHRARTFNQGARCLNARSDSMPRRHQVACRTL